MRSTTASGGTVASTEAPNFNRGRLFIGGGPLIYGGYPYYGYYAPAYGAGYSAPAYWYYCPSYGAYYPNVASCPEAWVPVPAW